MKKVAPALFLLLCMTVTGLGFRNVYSDREGVEPLARAAACIGKGPKCQARPKQAFFSPFGHEFDMVVAAKTMKVRCRRAYIFVGEYACTATAMP